MTSSNEMDASNEPAATTSTQVSSGGCSDCGGAAESVSYVYALGQIQCRFPSLSLEKEFAQALGRADTTGQTDNDLLYTVLSQRENAYIARKLCWVMSIEGLDTYFLLPRYPADLDLLIESIKPPRPKFKLRHNSNVNFDVDVVVGARGPIAPPQMCNGMQLPIIGFDQIYSFDVESLIGKIPRPAGIPEDSFEAAAETLFLRVMQIADNAGATDEHRALNYLALRYPAIYAATANAFAKDQSLSNVEGRPSRLRGVRNVVDVIFSFTHRTTDVTEKFFVRVDVTDQFPFLVTKLEPFYDRV